MPLCNNCGRKCKSENTLTTHKKTSKDCIKYKNIIFLCKCCDYYCIGIRNINIHLNTCEKKEDTPPDTHLLENISKLNSTIETQKRLYNIKKKRCQDLQLQLNFEKMKTQIFSNIIENQTGLRIGDIIQEDYKFDKFFINIRNYPNGNIPLVVHDLVNGVTEKKEFTICNKQHAKNISIGVKSLDSKEDKKDNVIQQQKQEEDTVDNESEKKKKIYRRIDTSVMEVKNEDKIEDIETVLQQNILEIDKKINIIKSTYFNISTAETIKQIDKFFILIQDNRIYTTHLMNIKNTRKKLLGKINLDKYTKLLLTHNKKLTKIFENKQQHSLKKIERNISKSLTPLDARLIDFGDYSNQSLEIDDINLFITALDVTTKPEKQFVPFDMKSYCEKTLNYSLALQPWYDSVSLTLFNRYGFHNVIYVPLARSKEYDPYSFYTLEKIDGKRCWKMECRLEDFSSDLANNLIQYCIKLFRKIYYNIFQDNLYRPDYISKSQITQQDGEQLLQNIIELSQPLKACLILRKLVKKKAVFIASKADKFNLYADDKIQQKRMTKAVDNEKDIYDVIKRVFDDIADEDCEKIVTCRDN